MSKSDGTVTIKSIAAALGVSFSTVSKALNGDPNVSPQTRELVEAKAREMHYTRNEFARSLRQKRSKTVAIILNDIDVPAYGEMIAMISSELAGYGYTTIVSDARYDTDMERSSLQAMLTRMPEAVIYSPADPTSENLQLLEPLYGSTLVLGDTAGRAAVSSLAVDHRLAGALSAERMLTGGSRKNLIFGGPEGYQSSELFLAGVREAYEKYDTPWDESLVFRFRPEQREAYHTFLKFWGNHPGGCTGVICFCDSMAFGIYRAARELGLSIPENVSVIGYDDSPVNDFTEPPLTTLHMPKDLVAKHCAQFVLDRLLGGDTRLHTYKLEPYLADRGSVRKG